MSLNAPHHKEQEYIIVYWWGSECFPRYYAFYEKSGWGMSPGYPGIMSLNAAYHKEQQYIWFMGGDLNGFRDITHFKK